MAKRTLDKSVIPENKQTTRTNTKPTLAQLKLITKMASKGHTLVNISSKLGMHFNTFARCRKMYPEIDEAITFGKASRNDAVLDRMHDILDNPKHPAHATMIIFYLKTQAGFSQAILIEKPQKPSMLKVTRPDAD